MKVLVTGANGFVGSWLCRGLQQRGADVRGLVRASSDLALLKDIALDLIVGDLEDEPSLARAVQGVDAIYHVAALVSDSGPWERFQRVNVGGTRLLLEAARRNEGCRFVYVSTAAVHSFLDAEVMDETSPQLPTRYGYVQSKREAEALVLSYHRRGDVEGVIIRPGDVYGPGDRTVLRRLAGLLRRGLLPYVDGGQKLGAFTYVENLGDAILRAGTVGAAAGEAYCITDGARWTWRMFFERLTGELGWPRPWLSVPAGLVRPAAAALEDTYGALRCRGRPPITRYLVEHMSSHFYFSIAKAQRELGYGPPVPIEEAIRRSAAWLREVAGEGPACGVS